VWVGRVRRAWSLDRLPNCSDSTVESIRCGLSKRFNIAIVGAASAKTIGNFSQYDLQAKRSGVEEILLPFRPFSRYDHGRHIAGELCAGKVREPERGGMVAEATRFVFHG
jgi:hypothetical protein